MGKGAAVEVRHVSIRRIVAISFAISCHLALIIALLRPVAPDVDVIPAQDSYQAALKLRFVFLPRLASTISASPPTRSVAIRQVSAKERPPPQAMPIAPIAIRAHEAGAISASIPPDASGSPVIEQHTAGLPSTKDGGFKNRMFDTQQSQRVRGVPGSDRGIAPGLELADPMEQGIGSVMRNTKRLFGVADHHCIDVDVWRHMSEDELIQRHLTSADIEKASAKYNCDRPLGLNF